MEELKSREVEPEEQEEVCYETLSPKNDSLTIKVSIDTLLWKKENYRGFNP